MSGLKLSPPWLKMPDMETIPYVTDSRAPKMLPREFNVRAMPVRKNNENGYDIAIFVFSQASIADGEQKWWQIKANSRKPLVNDRTSAADKKYVDIVTWKECTLHIKQVPNSGRDNKLEHKVVAIVKGGRPAEMHPYNIPTTRPGVQVRRPRA